MIFVQWHSLSIKWNVKWSEYTGWFRTGKKSHNERDKRFWIIFNDYYPKLFRFIMSRIDSDNDLADI